MLCIYRTPDEPAFEQSDIESLRVLLPHWRHALDLRSRLTLLNQQSGIAHCLLNHAPFAIMTVDAVGLVLYANHRAKVMTRLNDGLRIRDGRIASSNTAGTRKLLTELRRCEIQDPGIGVPVPFPLERPSGAQVGERGGNARKQDLTPACR